MIDLSTIKIEPNSHCSALTKFKSACVALWARNYSPLYNPYPTAFPYYIAITMPDVQTSYIP